VHERLQRVIARDPRVQIDHPALAPERSNRAGAEFRRGASDGQTAIAEIEELNVIRTWQRWQFRQLSFVPEKCTPVHGLVEEKGVAMQST
jgi:hypothetical protein